MSFVIREIDLSFVLASGSFAESGTNTVSVSGLRVSAHITRGGTTREMLEMDVYGLPPSIMKQLSTLGMIINVGLQKRNIVTVIAGDADNGMFTAFSGTIFSAYADFTRIPDATFHVSAQATLFGAIQYTNATSYTGPTSVATIMANFAKQLGLNFENNGVSTTLAYPYFSGSPYTQAQQCAKHAGIGWTIDSKSNTLAIWPRSQSRTTGSIPKVSKDTGMVGYPSFTAQGISVKSLWNAQFACGNRIQVETSEPVVQPANGIWAILTQEDHLESLVPHGEWYSIMNCYNPAFPAPIPQQ